MTIQITLNSLVERAMKDLRSHLGTGDEKLLKEAVQKLYENDFPEGFAAELLDPSFWNGGDIGIGLHVITSSTKEELMELVLGKEADDEMLAWI